MYPISTVDKTQCLQSLIGIRSVCAPGTNKPFWLEDIDGLDVQKLAKLARASSLKGEEFGNWLIGSAAREMMGDIELLMNNGYSMKNMVGDACSSCTLLPSYSANTGIVVKSAVASNFQTLRITSLKILANVTGTKELILDDGEVQEPYDVDLIAGVIMPIVLDFTTLKKSVKIYFTDPTVPLGRVSCPTTSSCGCGGSAQAVSVVSIAGLTAGVETSTQYGFIPCASVGCSYDLVVCNMISQTPNIFGLALMFKIGEKYLLNKNQSDRNNSTASFPDGQEEELQRNYGQLYWAKLKGTGNMKGVKNIINDYLKTKASDRCIVCESKLYTASAAG